MPTYRLRGISHEGINMIRIDKELTVMGLGSAPFYCSVSCIRYQRVKNALSKCVYRESSKHFFLLRNRKTKCLKKHSQSYARMHLPKFNALIHFVSFSEIQRRRGRRICDHTQELWRSQRAVRLRGVR